MDKQNFKNEKMYQITMYLIREMLFKEIISREDYCRIDTIFTEKYKPVFGALFYDINLTSEPK